MRDFHKKRSPGEITLFYIFFRYPPHSCKTLNYCCVTPPCSPTISIPKAACGLAPLPAQMGWQQPNMRVTLYHTLRGLVLPSPFYLLQEITERPTSVIFPTRIWRGKSQKTSPTGSLFCADESLGCRQPCVCDERVHPTGILTLGVLDVTTLTFLSVFFLKKKCSLLANCSSCAAIYIYIICLSLPYHFCHFFLFCCLLCSSISCPSSLPAVHRSSVALG